MIITNKTNLPPIVYNSIARHDHQEVEGAVSVTQLIGGACEHELKKRFDAEIEIDAQDLIVPWIGTAVHEKLEKEQCAAYQKQELFMEWDYPAKKLTGKCDLIDFNSIEITDYKTCKSWKYKFNDWADYEKQGKMYLLLAIHNGHLPEDLDIYNVRICAFVLDFQQSKADKDSEYPPYTCVQLERAWCYEELMEFERNFVIPKLEKFAKIEMLDVKDFPPCSKDERWQSEDKFAVVKKDRKAALRVLDSEKEALEWTVANGYANDKKVSIEFRPGVNKKCENYCVAKEFCEFYRTKVKKHVGSDN